MGFVLRTQIGSQEAEPGTNQGQRSHKSGRGLPRFFSRVKLGLAAHPCGKACLTEQIFNCFRARLSLARGCSLVGKVKPYRTGGRQSRSEGHRADSLPNLSGNSVDRSYLLLPSAPAPLLTPSLLVQPFRPIEHNRHRREVVGFNPRVDEEALAIR